MSLAVGDPSIAERPDSRQIVTFFLGFVFIEALRIASSSPWLQRVTRRSSRQDLSSDRSSSQSSPNAGIQSLDFLLPTCFALSSLSHFISLLGFGDSTGCAFVIAFASIFQQFARLLAALIIVLDLRQIILRMEVLFSLVWLLIGVVAAFVDSALSTGSLVRFSPLNTAFCTRRTVLAPALVSSMMYISLELYIILRLFFILHPRTLLHSRHDFGKSFKILQRPLSLLALEILSIVPVAVTVQIVAIFIPFSIGQLLVLFAFEKKPVTPSPIALPYLSPRASPLEPKTLDISAPAHYSNPPRTAMPASPLPTFSADSFHQHFRHPFSAIALQGNESVPESIGAQNEPSRSRGSLHDRNADVSKVSRSAGNSQNSNDNMGRSSRNPPKLPPLNSAGFTSRKIVATPDSLLTQQAGDTAWQEPSHTGAIALTPTPLSARPQLLLTTRLSMETDSLEENQHVSTPNSAVYGSDIIRMTSSRDPTKAPVPERYSVTSYSRMSHLTVTTDSHSHGESARQSFTAATSGGQLKRYPTFGGRSGRQSKRSTANSFGSPHTLPQPLPDDAARLRSNNDYTARGLRPLPPPPPTPSSMMDLGPR